MECLPPIVALIVIGYLLYNCYKNIKKQIKLDENHRKAIRDNKRTSNDD